MDVPGFYIRSCVITVTNEKSKEGTCSGVLIDTNTGIVLAHASLLSPLLNKKSQIIQDIRNFRFSESKETKKFSIEIILQPRPEKNKNVEKSERFQPNLLKNNLQETNSMDKFNASFLYAFQSPSLKSALGKLVPSGSWEFVEDLSEPNNKKSDKDNLDHEDSVYYELLPCFILLRIHDWFGYKSYLPYKISLDNQIGDNVEITATPFGGLNPEVFLNSRSQGIISNIAGKDQVLLMVDARCIPGSEGGALYYTQGKTRLLTGIIIATLCWKNSEWIGLSLACSISEILKTLTRLPITLSEFEPSGYEQVVLQSPHNSTLTNICKAIKFLSVGSNWGSGVIISELQNGQQLMLTCSHVVRGSDHSPVKIRTNQAEKEQTTAEVVYKTPAGKHFDLAALLCSSSHMTKKYSEIELAPVQEGEPVYVIGHAIFGETLDLQPTVTRGIVSKVIKVNDTQIMLQTTCAVHAGASGGAVVNMNGQLVGLVICNAKDTVSGASYPHVNMCVPIATISKILEKYKNTLDESVLHHLHIQNPKVRHLWTLGNSSTGSKMEISSKL